MLSNPRTRLDRVSVKDSAHGILRAVSGDMHVFEIDRRGESARIWEEIEQRTKSLQAVQASSQPEPALKDNQTPGAASEPKGSRVPSYKNQAPHFVPQYEDESSALFDESDHNNGPQELRGSRATNHVGRYTAEDLLELQRERYFQASNPPKLSSDPGNQGERPARHTSMRLSDVLNDDNEAKEVTQETEPLLVAYREGNLTKEGKRQVRVLLASIFYPYYA